MPHNSNDLRQAIDHKSRSLELVFADDSLIVFDKPPGLVVTSTETHKGETLEDILRGEYQISVDRGGVVHRLDKDTSGLIVVAKTQSSLENLQAQFKERSVEKEYLALVRGWVEEPGKVEGAIGRNPGDRERFVVFNEEKGPNVRPAVTLYKPKERLVLSEEKKHEIFEGFNKIQFRKLAASGYGKFTLLLCHPLTGRTHQIRVHLKYKGFPLVGDEKYGGRKTVRLDHRFCPRQFLHAARLEFDHPVSGKRMKFESKLPEDLNASLAVLEEVK